MLVENINHFEKRKYPSKEKIIKTKRRYIYYFEEKKPQIYNYPYYIDYYLFYPCIYNLDQDIFKSIYQM